MNALCVCKGLWDGHARKPSLSAAPDSSHWSFCVPVTHTSVFTQRRPHAISLHAARISTVDQKSLEVHISNFLIFHILEYWLEGIASKEVQTFSFSAFLNILMNSPHHLLHLAVQFTQNTMNMSQKYTHKAYQIPEQQQNCISPLTWWIFANQWLKPLCLTRFKWVPVIGGTYFSGRFQLPDHSWHHLSYNMCKDF